jgi:hypothetical protein
MLIFLVFSAPLPSMADNAAGATGVEDTVSTEEEESEGALDTVSAESPVARTGFTVWADLRPILTYLRVDRRDGSEISEEDLGVRARLGVRKSLFRTLWAGAGIAGRCFTDNCDPEFVMHSETPGPNGLRSGQFTFDELYLHWFREGKGRFDILLGRQQTRFALRSGVYFKSLDRNDSNNTRITWTDGLHAAYRAGNGWRSSFVLQRNTDDGTGSIRRGPLNFDDSAAKNTYFLGFENLRPWGLVVQRSLDLSYLPRSLLKDNDPEGRREDYWGLVGRLAVRWPRRSEGPHFRGGVEVGYAPKTPSRAAAGFDEQGDADGLAWNVAANVMDIWPGHSAGVNYGRTGAGWLLSPQFFPGTELIEFRYLWRLKRGPLLEARVRRQDDLDTPEAAERKRSEYDFYFRLTWEFGGGFSTRTL